MSESARDFQAFRRHVFSDAALLQRLLAANTMQALLSAALQEGSAHGYQFVATDVTSEVNRTRRDWFEQWIAPAANDAPNALPHSLESDCADFSGWLPIRFFVRDSRLWVDWRYAGARRLKQPFFTGDVMSLLTTPFNLAFSRYTPIEALAQWAATLRERGQEAPLNAVIAHVSRCGSTLVTQMLTQLPTHRVLSEPPMLDMLLNAARTVPQTTREQQVTWLRSLLTVLGQSANDESVRVLKLDAWHILEIELLQAAFPAADFVLIFRDPQAVAASHAKEPSSYMMPGASSGMPWSPPHDPAVWSNSDRYLAAVLGKIYQAGVDACERQGVRAVNYTDLPDSVFAGLAETFCVPPDATAQAPLKQRAAQHAKRSTEAFDANADHLRTAASSVVLRDAVDASCAASYARLMDAATRHS